MKRIMYGKTFNTDTATLIAQIGDPLPRPREDTSCESLYQSRYGPYFLVREEYLWVEQVGHEEKDTLDPLSAPQARSWLEQHRPDLVQEQFRETSNGGAREVKFTLRMPESLRRRLEVLAKQREQSLNAWIIRCMENCARSQEGEKGNGGAPWVT